MCVLYQAQTTDALTLVRPAPSPGRHLATATGRHRSAPSAEAGPQDFLVELAHRRAGDGVDHLDALGQLPFGEAPGQQVVPDVVDREILAGLSTTQTNGRSCHLGSGTAMTAASTTLSIRIT